MNHIEGGDREIALGAVAIVGAAALLAWCAGRPSEETVRARSEVRRACAEVTTCQPPFKPEYIKTGCRHGGSCQEFCACAVVTKETNR